MKLEDIADEYAASLESLRARMRELQARINEEEDPVEVGHLKARCNALRPILRETKELASYCKNYYKRSECNVGPQNVQYKVERVDRRYGCMASNDRPDERRPDVTPEAEPAVCNGGGADSTPARDAGHERIPKQKRNRNRKRTEHQCIDSIPHFDAGKETLAESSTLFLLKAILD